MIRTLISHARAHRRHRKHERQTRRLARRILTEDQHASLAAASSRLAAEAASEVVRQDRDIWAIPEALGLTKPLPGERIYGELLADRAVTA